MEDSTVVSVKNVYKDFKLPHEKVDSLKSAFAHPFKKRGNAETQHALKNISFEVKKGEFFGIVGRNGSGKSTLLKIIAGIYQPTKGQVKVNGRLVPFIELGVGFNPELTGHENVFLNGALMGFSNKEIARKLPAIVEFAELERFMDQKLKNYSSGMQVRLAFSVATILAESDILLIDEVLAVGDADFQRKCFEYFSKLKKDKKTVIFVSHDMNAVREYCDRVVLIDENKLIMTGKSEKVAKQYTKLFLTEEEEAPKKVSQKWGDGGVDISELKSLKKRYTPEDKFLEISFVMTAQKGFSAKVKPGLTIKDGQGRSICGTNSQILRANQSEFIFSKDTTRIGTTWTIPNIFNEGTYTVEPAVLNAETHATLEWWDEALKFKVVNEKSVPYIVAPDIQLKSQKLG